ncbi:MAG TPA: WbqC family protein [Chitinophagaceae bacterium]|jgi:hypothetical protein|nr:WbqC family protein [Chitinophagaceae bacterium]
MNLVIEIQYFAPVSLFYHLHKIRNAVFEVYEHYQKLSFRNRCFLASANGPISISIPVRGGRNVRQLITEIQVAPGNWREQHWRTISTCYRKAPWFDHYAASLQELYQSEYDMLSDWNLACFEWVCRQLSLDISHAGTDCFQKVLDPDRFLDLRNKVLPKNYKEFPAPRYIQLFEERVGFQPNLSILDLLFCCGPQSRTVLGNTK